MKKTLALATFLVFSLFGTTLSAQGYQSAVGLRLGYPIAISYKTFLNESSAIEVYGSYRRRGVYSYHYTTFGLGATYQMHNDLSSVADGLQWFYGAGAGVSFFKWSDDTYFQDEGNLGVSIHGSLGLDYLFSTAPVNISVDWKPTFALTGYGNGFGAGYGAFSVRYVLGGE